MIILWTILLSILGLLILILLWVLLVPFRLEIDSEQGIYRAGIPWLIKAWIEPARDFFIVRLRILFMNYWFDPFSPAQKKKTQETSPDVRKEKKRPERHKKKKKLPAMNMVRPAIRMMRATYRAIRLRKLTIDFDTGDDVLNAKLVPVCYMISRENRSIMVNFDDFQRIILDVRTRLVWFVFNGIRFGWDAFVRPRIKIR